MQIIEMKTADLKPYPYNTKKHDQTQVDNVAESIKEFGFVQPLVVDGDNVVVIGHCRLLRAKKLKMKTVPCFRAEELTEEQTRKLRILDNKTNESPWDFDFLESELADLDLSNYDLDFNIDFSAEVDDAPIVEDEPPEVDEEKEPTAKLGDIWQLGRHRLMCGDSTKREDVKNLTGGVKADMVFTDPPYGMKKEKEGVANDNLNYDNLLEFNKKWVPIAFDFLKDTGSWYCWGIDEPLMDIYSNILKPMQKANKITFRNLLTWDKGCGQGQLSESYRMYPIADEKCLFVMKGVQGFNTNADNYFEAWEPIRLYLEEQRLKCGWNIPKMKEIAGHSDKSSDHWTGKSQWNLIPEYVYIKFQNWATEHQVDAFKKEYDEIKKEYYSTRAYFNNTHDNMNNVWHFDRTSTQERETSGGHATPKPIALCSRAIKSSSRENEVVLDLFGGSGSTLISCEELNRKAFLMELEPKWVDVIIKRWENLTGQKAKLIQNVYEN